jgi:hypothetical protein
VCWCEMIRYSSRVVSHNIVGVTGCTCRQTLQLPPSSDLAAASPSTRHSTKQHNPVILTLLLHTHSSLPRNCPLLCAADYESLNLPPGTFVPSSSEPSV